MVQGDLRRPAELLALPEVSAHLDFGKPVAVLLFAVLHFLPDDADPAGVVACLRDSLAPGSYLAISPVGRRGAQARGVARARRPRACGCDLRGR